MICWRREVGRGPSPCFLGLTEDRGASGRGYEAVHGTNEFMVDFSIQRILFQFYFSSHGLKNKREQ